MKHVNLKTAKYNKEYLLEVREILNELSCTECSEIFADTLSRYSNTLANSDMFIFLLDNAVFMPHSSQLLLAVTLGSQVDDLLGELDYKEGFISIYSLRYINKLIRQIQEQGGESSDYYNSLQTEKSSILFALKASSTI